MPKIVADFSKVSSSFEALPEGQYRFQIEDIIEDTTDSGPRIQVKSKVLEGNDKVGEQFTDFLYMMKNDKSGPNKRSLGQIKSYAEAILGTEAANSPEGIDTDELKLGQFVGIVKHESYEKKDKATGASLGQGSSAKLVKIMAV